MRPGRPIALALALAALAVAGCSEESSEEAAKKDESNANLHEEAGGPPKVSGELGRKPRIEIQKGEPPRRLETEDIVEGKGASAKAGARVAINYVGVSYSDGKEFDTSFGKEPFEFPLGAGEVIPGFDEGIAGMKVGGRRRLTIPPDQAYGPQGQPPAIGPNETLVFVVDLVRMRQSGRE